MSMPCPTSRLVSIPARLVPTTVKELAKRRRADQPEDRATMEICAWDGSMESTSFGRGHCKLYQSRTSPTSVRWFGFHMGYGGCCRVAREGWKLRSAS